MVRYRLDDLGWFQFESMVQSLLKAEFGVGVESWGGTNDFGRDAYCPGPLRFPDKKRDGDGPFLFQVKFVQNANAAGAKSDDLVIDAVRNECSRIRERMSPVAGLDADPATRIKALLQSARGRPFWSKLRNYVFVTNAPFSAALRTRINDLLLEVLPDVNVHTLGGSDICDLLDDHPNLRRAFPQVLSLRDLDDLLANVVDRDILNASRLAIEAAKEVCYVFVPTSAFERSWEVLRKHHFLVLEGPPEMGKTAIARMIALTQLAAGWEAVVCQEPEDVFRRLVEDRRQVFIADDAFGRTEYDPARGRKWEQRLEAALRAVNAKHWLIWTSRKHILERALKSMDLQGQAHRFPNPAAVLVDAGQLSLKEKSLILYRHTRAANLEEGLRKLIRSNAISIVYDPNFTPERIRRFIHENLPELDLVNQNNSEETIYHQIREAIRNPTERMRKTFASLSPAHKWLLITLLEAGTRLSRPALLTLYTGRCPSECRRAGGEALDELREAFIKGDTEVDWMHPSYRDLVIDELARDGCLQQSFLSSTGLGGIKLAISDTGGAGGDRRLPLMNSPESWHALRLRSEYLAENGTASEIAELISALDSASKAAEDANTCARFREILSAVCSQACRTWNGSGEALEPNVLSTYVAATTGLAPLPPIPDLWPSWVCAEGALRRELDRTSDGRLWDHGPFTEWLALVLAASSAEPRFLRQIRFPQRNVDDIGRVLERIVDKVESAMDWDSRSEMETVAGDTFSLAGALLKLWKLAPKQLFACRTAAIRLRKELVPKLKGEAENAQSDDEDPGRTDYGESTDTGSFGITEIQNLFADL